MQKNSQYAAVILAGGKGTRIAPFSDRYPKPLLPIMDRPVILHQIDTCAALGIREIFIVIGTLGNELAARVGNGSERNLTIHYVEQGEPLGISHALGRVAQLVDRPFLLMLGDIYFVATDLTAMLAQLKSEQLDGVLAVTDEPDHAAIQRNYIAILGANGLVTRVIEKPRRVSSNLKGCGIYLFSPSIFDAVQKTPRTVLRNEYELTDSIQILIQDGGRVGVNRSILEDVNLTTPQDLWRCNLSELRRRGLNHYIGAGAELPTNAVLDHSVIGRGAHIADGLTVRNSVIFPETAVNQDLVDAIAFDDLVFYCGEAKQR